jgi:hypothetical protein
MGPFWTRLSSYVANALRYWEPRRVVYNAVLAGVVLTHFALAWPGSREQVSLNLLLGLFILAVVASIAFSVVYAVDLFVQFSGLELALRWARVILLIVGTAFAATFAHFMAQGMFQR